MWRRRLRKSTMYLRAGIDRLPRMNKPRSAVPGFAIAIAVLIAGLLLALTVGRYPVGLGELISVLYAKATGHGMPIRSCPNQPVDLPKLML